MTEVFPQKIDQKKFEARLQKLIAGFLMVAADFVKENEDRKQQTEIAWPEKIPARL